MPSVDLQNFNSSVSCCLWQISEPEEFFWPRLQLLPDDAASIRALKTPFRRLERLACRAALSQLMPYPTSVTYSDNGAPKLPDAFLSFSHCKNFAAAALSTNAPVGIDVEPISDRILQLHSRFVNEAEKKFFDVCNPHHLHLVWSAKEAMFKCVHNAPVDFLNRMSVRFTSSPGKLSGTVYCPDHIVQTTISYKELCGLVLAVCEPTRCPIS